MSDEVTWRSADAAADPGGGGTSTCCRGLPHVDRDRAVSTVARRSTGAHLPPPPPPRRSDWAAWTSPASAEDSELPAGSRSGELTSTV